MRRLAAAALAAVTVLVASGCGTGGISKGGDVSAGKRLYVENCASCHVMADAGPGGKIGPNLDQAFGPARTQGFEESTIQQVVRDQIALANPPMPQNLVTGDDAEAVAAYVTMCAGWTKQTPCATAATAPPATTTAETTTAATTTAPTTTAATATTETGPTETVVGDAAKGKELYTSLGCAGCHTLDGTKTTGPSFKGLFGRETRLASGQTVTADDVYLLEAILDPDKQIVAGFAPGVMSAVIKPGQVSRQDALDLIAFIKTLK